MVTETLWFFFNGPHSYEAETVSELRNGEWPQFLAYPNVLDLTFSHVLNVQPSEDVWPGDATELFFPDVFAVRLVGEGYGYRLCGEVWEHIREEILRLADHPETRSLDSMWTASFMLYCYERDGSYADKLFDDAFSEMLPTKNSLAEDIRATTRRPFEDDTLDGAFCDGCDDEWDEADTMNSELLLPYEYEPPEMGTQDCGEFEQDAKDSALSPRRRVNMFLPTERKDN